MFSLAWQESLTGRLAAGLSRTCRHSVFCRWLTDTAWQSRQNAVRGSLFARMISYIACLLLRPLQLAGQAVRRGLPGSFLLNLKPHPAFQSSILLTSLAGIRVETALAAVICYPAVDFALRNSRFALLASNWDELLLILLVLAWPVQMALRGKMTYRLTPMDMPIMLFLAAAVFLFLVRSPQMGVAVEGLRVYVEYVLWFFAASNLLLNKKQARVLVNLLVALGTLIALHGVYQYIIGVEIPSTWLDSAEGGVRTRVFSILSSPNVLGSFLVLLIPLTVSQLLSANNRLQRYYYIACLAPMALSLFFTYSRGAWLAMAGAFLIYGLIYNWRILLALGAAAYTAPKLIPGISSRIGYMLSPAYLLSSARAGRVARWNKALEKLQNNPLFGEGFGRYGGAVAARYIPSSNYVDNFYLKTAAESGIIGLAAFVWLLFSGVRCILNSYRRLTDPYLKGLAGGLFAGLMGVLLHNGVENIFEVPTMCVYFWLLLGMAAALPHLGGQETPPLD
ncbi:O-antigen ligase family protein [Pelotomaculum propionicicum]|uniref:O-antigen ligase family protein n=1 Tax=Pelotomaculum propionicicum TaxID=258475 RepID=UPI003B80C093